MSISVPAFLQNEQSPFPDPNLALREPDGLLAVGGSLSVERLTTACKMGIFPWYNPGQPVLWWSPNPRLVLHPSKLHISRSLNKLLKKGRFTITYDQEFNQVIRACAAPRSEQEGTWLSEEMISAYNELHRLGIAHSVEAWHDGELAGGLYGIALGKVFFGESMFSRQNNASKCAFVTFVKTIQNWGFELVDCQVKTNHLSSLGAEQIPRQQFLTALRTLCDDQNYWVGES